MTSKQYYINNKERINKKNLDYYYANRERYIKKRVEYARLKKFGMIPELYEEMLNKQNNKCGICGTDKPGGRGQWHIDHCHKTNKIRGLLCQKCNMALGMFGDNIEVLLNAVKWLSLELDAFGFRKT